MKNTAHLSKHSLALLVAAVVLAPLAAQAAVPTKCKGHDVTIFGTDGPDPNLQGTPGDDVIHGGDGRDIIHGGGGNDVICGGTGDDDLYGDDGEDKLYGGGGSDTLEGGKNKDCLQGDPGDGFGGGGGTDHCTQAGASCEVEFVPNCASYPW